MITYMQMFVISRQMIIWGKLLTAIQHTDVETFGAIIEQEALTLHALMMTSSPSFYTNAPKYNYYYRKSAAVLEKIRERICILP